MAASNLRFGQHATREVGMDFTNMISQLPSAERANAKIGVFTDPNVAKLDVMKVVEESLMKEGLNWVIYDKVAVEPTDKSWTVSLHPGNIGGLRCQSDVVVRHRLCSFGPYNPFLSCWWWIRHGHRQGCEPVHQLS